MPRPNLSVETIARTLAALGTSAALVACTKAAEPAAVKADQAPPPAASAATPAAPMVAPAKPTEEPKGGPGAAGNDALPKEQSATPSATAAASEVPAHHAAPGRRHRGTAGQASCGAGTCTADTKKK